MRQYQKFIFRVLIPLILSYISCQKSHPILSDLIAPNWQNGDKYYYEIYRNNQLIGYTQQILHFDMEDKKPTYVLELLSEIDWQETYLSDSTVVCFSRQDFAPIWSYRKLETDFDSRIVEVHYDESNIDIWTETMDGKDAKSLSVKGTYFDNEMVFWLMRCLQWEKGKRYSIKIINPFLLQVALGTVSYGGKAIIKTLSGTFDCDKINLTFDSEKYNLFIERTSSRRLIQIQEKHSNLTLVLVEKTPQSTKITSR
ncbi:MAG: DUF3108 domain-containing protein [candidate division WOR-3 bacterium]|nr:DUF3108 domain-containing protein [candidate division WOR-3 bacterium]